MTTPALCRNPTLLENSNPPYPPQQQNNIYMSVNIPINLTRVFTHNNVSHTKKKIFCRMKCKVLLYPATKGDYDPIWN